MTHYVTQTGAGDYSGTSLANAKAVANVAELAISGDDIVILSGTFTSQLTLPASGTAGHPVIYRFATGAKFAAATWPTGAIYADHKSYFTIDGDVADGRQGIIECTDNGTLLGNKVSAYGVRLNTCHHCTVKNLTIQNIYVRVEGTETNDYGHGVSSYYGSGGTTMSDITVTNCLIHDAYIGCWFSYVGTCTNLEFSNSEVYNTNWCGAAGNANNTSTLNGLLVYGNNFHDWTNWDETSSVTFHHNGFFTWGNSGGTATAIRYYNNTIGPNFTNGVGGNHSTSGLFVQNDVSDVLIYNNTFVATDDNPSTGFIYLNPGAWLTSTYKIFNNTWSGASAGIGMNFTPATTGAGTQTLTIKNNIFKNTETAISIFKNGTVSLTSDDNLVYGVVAAKAFSYSATTSSAFLTVASWQSYGFDADLTTSDPVLDGNYAALSSGPCAGVGEDLSATFTTDKAGQTRVMWDLGALNVSLLPPSSLSATAGGSASIALAWTDGSSDESGFKVERSADQSTWLVIATTVAGAVSYTDSGLYGGTTYYYRVRAYNSFGYSAYSNTGNATTDAAAPTGSSRFASRTIISALTGF